MSEKELAEKAERIRQATWDYIREHGLVDIMEDDDDTSYKDEIKNIISGS